MAVLVTPRSLAAALGGRAGGEVDPSGPPRGGGSAACFWKESLRRRPGYVMYAQELGRQKRGNVT